MSLAPTLPAAIVETVLARVALLFLSAAAGDETAARDAARQTLEAYQPHTATELRLAAKIVGFSFHALEALAQATAEDLPASRVMRLRGSAVSLSRESHKAERRLEIIQAARRSGAATEPLAAAPDPEAPPRIEQALTLIEETATVQAVAKAAGISWTQAYRQRERARRIADNLRKNQAAHASGHDFSAMAPTPPPATAPTV